MFSDSDIKCLLDHLSDDCDPNDRLIIEERLRKFVYDPLFESPFYTKNEKNEKRSIEDKEWYQALARIGEYSKGEIKANEI